MFVRLQYRKLFYLLVLLLPKAVFSQVTVTGPTCAISGTVYQYLISGPWDTASTMQVCLTGGVTADSGQACTSVGQPRPFVLVTWDSSGTVTLQISSSKGNTSITVTLTDTLSGGTIDSTGKIQSILYDSVPAAITCPAATGGSCSPSYTYQWQQSSDMLAWQDISGATSQNVTPSQFLQQQAFIRRKVTETASGTVGYSDIAIINVGPPPPTSSIRFRMASDVAYAHPILHPKSF